FMIRLSPSLLQYFRFDSKLRLFWPYRFVSFFFFQAEDGIRDATVTGIQTCALPISGLPFLTSISVLWPKRFSPSLTTRTRLCGRSEERRVGKECRYRWWVDH